MASSSRIRSTAALVGLAAVTSIAAGQVRISQVGKGSGLDPNAYNGNYVELFNAGTEAVSLAGKSLQWASTSAGAGWTKLDLEGVIQPGKYWLVRLTSTNAGPDPTAGFGLHFAADQNRLGFNGTYTSVTFTNSAGKVVLADTTTQFTTNGCSGVDVMRVLDMVSWSTAASTAGCYEGSALALIPLPGMFEGGIGTTSVLRLCGGLRDTNDNFADFTSTGRPPRSSTYAGAADVPAVSGKTQVTGQTGRGTTTGFAGQTVLFTSGQSACSGTIQSVTIDLSAVGGAAAQVMYDDGTHGDGEAGDGVYSYVYTIPPAPAAPLGAYALVLSGTDSTGRTGTGLASLIVAPPTPANDQCVNAEVIPAGPLPFFGSATGSLVSATPIGLIGTTCTTNTGSAGTSRDVWYSFTPTETGYYTISTCNNVTAPGLFTGTATNLTIFDTCPAEGASLSGLSLACASNSCGTFIGGGPSTIFSAPLDQGVPYLIRVARAGSGDGIVAGPFRLDVFSENFGACCLPIGLCSTLFETDCVAAGGTFVGPGTTCTTSSSACPAAPAPENNECTTARPLALGTPAAGTTFGATGTDLSRCDNTSWDVWYSYTPDQSGTLHVHVDRTSGLETPAIAVFDTCAPGTDTDIACVNVPIQGTTNDLEFEATAGTAYFIRIATHFSQRITFAVTLDEVAPGCIGDFNEDGGVDGADVESFFVVWSNGESSADLNQDGGIDGGDVETFFGHWEAGC
jgi:hypothetical protein